MGLENRKISEGFDVSQKGVEFLKEATPNYKGDTRLFIKSWLDLAQRGISQSQVSEGTKNRIKAFFHSKFVLKPEDFPTEKYFEIQRRALEEIGMGEGFFVTEEKTNDAIAVTIEDQKQSLNEWVNYFTSPDSKAFPIWAKYWAFLGMTKLSGTIQIDKNTNEIKFKKREKNTTAPFPELNTEALALAVRHITSKVEDGENLNETLVNTNFGDVYSFYLNKLRSEAREKNLGITEGEWVKYQQRNSEDAESLVKSLRGYFTGWCTAEKHTATYQLLGGDFYVFYTKNDQGQPVVPRIAIRMEGNKIAEVRGIASDQNLDEVISGSSVLSEKLVDFGEEGEKFKKRDGDMKRITNLKKALIKNRNLELDSNILDFIYERNYTIESFGYERDPRIDEIKTFLEFRKKYQKSEIDESVIEKLFTDPEIKIGNLIEFIDSKFHKQIALYLIADKQGELVAAKLDKFQGLNYTEIAIALIKNNEGWSLVNNLEKFRNINHKNMIDKLIEERYSWAIAQNLNKFRELDQNEIAKKIFERGQGDAVASNVNRFKRLNEEIAIKFIENNYSRELAQNLENFEGLTEKVALRLIEEGQEFTAVTQMERFKIQDYNEIAFSVINKGRLAFFISNLFRFKNLNQKVADKLIQLGYFEDVKQNIRSFEEIQIEKKIEVQEQRKPSDQSSTGFRKIKEAFRNLLRPKK